MEATFRNLIVSDWVIAIYILVSLLLITAKVKSNYKFLNFIRLFFSDTYIKTYKEDSLFKGFHLLILVFSLIFFPLIIQVILFKIKYLAQFEFLEYFKIVLIFSVFFLLKMTFQLLLARIIGLKKSIARYVFQKQTYFSYVTFIGLLPLLFFVYTPDMGNFWLYLFVILWFVIFSLSMLLVLTNFKELFFNHLVYFILYLCAFEISPIIGVIYYITRL